MSRFLRLTDIDGDPLLIDKALIITVLTANTRCQECREIVTINRDISYYVKDSIDSIQKHLEED